MTPAPEDRQRRYRRRILGLGAALFIVLFVTAAFVAIGGVEDDLEGRVGAELGAAGFSGVTVHFSGQDGTLTCAEPLDDAGEAARIAEGEWGVRAVEVDPSCVSDDADADGEQPTGDDDTTTSTEVAPPSSAASTTVVTQPSPTTTVAEPAATSIVTVVQDDPQFSQFAGLLSVSGADETLSAPGSFTLFAPTDAAFDAAFETLGPDAFAELTSDPALVEMLVLHHVTDADLTTTSLEPGALDMLDGSAIEVRSADDGNGLVLVSGESTAQLEPGLVDVEAANGVVHAIDAVLLPEGLELGAEVETEPDVSIEFVDGRYTLVGSIASDGQRNTLLGAVAGVVEPANVDDALVVVAGATPTDEDVARTARLLGVVPANLVRATITLGGGDLVVSAVHAGVDQLAAVEAVAAEVGAALDAAPRPLADEASAGTLQDEVNALVQAEPIVFEPNSADIAESSAAIVEQVAVRLAALDGTSIIVVGHTDSDGRPSTNQQLSEARAAAVVEALVGEGLEPALLTAEGRGQREPVLVDGVEDKAASRRVEFIVVATT